MVDFDKDDLHPDNWNYGAVCLALSGFYGILVLISFVQLVRVKIILPKSKWDSQKLFWFLTALSSTLRLAFFIYVYNYEAEDSYFIPSLSSTLFTVFDDLPALIFFTTYTQLLVFWASIIANARSGYEVYSRRLRPLSVIINLFVYISQTILWGMYYFAPIPNDIIERILNLFFAGVSLLAALGFIVVGLTLFVLLIRVKPQDPILAKSRRYKLIEVALVTLVCFSAFLARSVLVVYSQFKENLVTEPWSVFAYFFCAELIPSLLVLFVLRKLPRKKSDQTTLVSHRRNGRGSASRHTPRQARQPYAVPAARASTPPSHSHRGSPYSVGRPPTPYDQRV